MPKAASVLFLFKKKIRFVISTKTKNEEEQMMTRRFLPSLSLSLALQFNFDQNITGMRE